mgnify:CR=1 FL=1
MLENGSKVMKNQKTEKNNILFLLYFIIKNNNRKIITATRAIDVTNKGFFLAK